MEPTINSIFNGDKPMAIAVIKPSSCLTTGIQPYLIICEKQDPRLLKEVGDLWLSIFTKISHHTSASIPAARNCAASRSARCRSCSANSAPQSSRFPCSSHHRNHFPMRFSRVPCHTPM